MRILLVDDEIKMAALLKRGLQEEGYAVDVAGTAEDAVWMGSENPYDAIVLDVMLPDGSGFDVCKQLRKARQWAPVIMLTARDAVADRVAGLDGGADDYLTKPFSFAELWRGCVRCCDGARSNASPYSELARWKWTRPPERSTSADRRSS